MKAPSLASLCVFHSKWGLCGLCWCDWCGFSPIASHHHQVTNWIDWRCWRGVVWCGVVWCGVVWCGCCCSRVVAVARVCVGARYESPPFGRPIKFFLPSLLQDAFKFQGRPGPHPEFVGSVGSSNSNSNSHGNGHGHSHLQPPSARAPTLQHQHQHQHQRHAGSAAAAPRRGRGVAAAATAHDGGDGFGRVPKRRRTTASAVSAKVLSPADYAAIAQEVRARKRARGSGAKKKKKQQRGGGVAYLCGVGGLLLLHVTHLDATRPFVVCACVPWSRFFCPSWTHWRSAPRAVWPGEPDSIRSVW